MASQEDNLILFFHEQSPACQKLKQFLPKDKKIQIVNVAQTPNVPREITSIPALVVNNKEVLLGKKVFDYFNKSDEMEYFNFSGKGGSSAFAFSTLDDNEELGERTSFDFQRPIGTREVFRSSSSVTYSETSKGVDLKQKLLLRHFFSETIAAGVSGEIAAHTRPSMVVDAYVVAFEYRQRIWRDWLYFDLNPQARFPFEADFEFTPFLGLSLEVIF